MDIYVKAPNQRTMIVHTDGGDRTTACERQQRMDGGAGHRINHFL